MPAHRHKNPGNNGQLRPPPGPSRLTNTADADCYAAALPARDDQEKGLLGNLPNRRPSVETPRRAEARRTGEAGGGAHNEQEGTAAEPQADASGLEELAKASAGLAVDAAGVGLKLAGRAVGRIGRLAGRD
jgi:hypothetical protein